MKKGKYFFYLFCLVLANTSCNNHDANNRISNKGGTFELLGKDTINVTDANGLKQGVWYTYETSTSVRNTKDTTVYKDGHPVN